MKIGILTQPLYNNYGGILQNYALQTILRQMGHVPITIDWKYKQTLTIKAYIYNLLCEIKGLLGFDGLNTNYQLSAKEDEIIVGKLNNFVAKYICSTTKAFSELEIDHYISKLGIDAIIVGSDQCWRPMYNPFLSSMYGNFTKHNLVKLAYAASFGTDIWEYTEEETMMARQAIKDFMAISVREDSGVKLCKNYLHANATHVLDPTMLLERLDYSKIVEEENENRSEGNLFYYILDPSECKMSFIDKVAKVSGLSPFMVMPKYKAGLRTRSHVKHSIQDCIYPTVTKWLRAIMDAEMTIVDSFHGCVFSILFNKPFWVLANEHRGQSRMSSLLKTFGLEDRLVTSMEVSQPKAPIDWCRVNAILSEKRSSSLEFLEKSFANYK